MTKKRIYQLDAIKGVAIILVALGHCIYVFGSNIFALKLLDKWIYIFHMPLFFLVSGYLFKPEGAILKNMMHLISFHWNSNFVLNALVGE